MHRRWVVFFGVAVADVARFELYVRQFQRSRFRMVEIGHLCVLYLQLIDADRKYLSKRVLPYTAPGITKLAFGLRPSDINGGPFNHMVAYQTPLEQLTPLHAGMPLRHLNHRRLRMPVLNERRVFQIKR